jgi:hypothetical protein
LSLVYSSGTDEDVDLILTGPKLKLAIDKFATNNTRYIDSTAFEQALRVDTYMSSFGIHKICLERNVPNGAILGVDTASGAPLGWLDRRVAIKPLGKTGSSTKALMEGEATVEALNEKSSFYASGYFFG